MFVYSILILAEIIFLQIRLFPVIKAVGGDNLEDDDTPENDSTVPPNVLLHDDSLLENVCIAEGDASTSRAKLSALSLACMLASAVLERKIQSTEDLVIEKCCSYLDEVFYFSLFFDSLIHFRMLKYLSCLLILLLMTKFKNNEGIKTDSNLNVDFSLTLIFLISLNLIFWYGCFLQIIAQRRNWAVQASALLQRSEFEKISMRRVQRACMQMESLSKLMNNERIEKVRWI